MAPGAGLLAGRALRGGRWSLLGLALVVALGGGASITAAVAAYRTDHAYGEYVRDAAIGDLVLNPSVRTREVDEAIRGFDGVDTVRADTLLFASVAVTEPTRIADASDEDSWLQVRGSTDGRYVDVDRPAVSAGRVPSGEREVFVSSDYHAELEQLLDRPLAVGDRIDVGFFWAGTLDGDVDPEAVVEPLGVESLRIAGFGLLPNEVLPEELFPRQQLIVSEDVTARYGCLESLGDATNYDEILRTVIPEDCSASYEYYSLSLQDGVDGAPSIRRQFDEAVDRLNQELPPELNDLGIGYYYISQDRSDLDAAVRETIRPTVVTLQAFALVAALTTVTITGLIVARQTRRDREVQRSLRALGATRGEITLWSASPPIGAVLVGLVAALGLAYVLSPLGPLGTVRALAPSPDPSLPAAVALPMALALTVALIVVIAAVRARAAWRLAGVVDQAEVRSGRASRLVRHGRPTATTGVGAALDTRRAGVGIAAMVGCVVATGAAAAAIVFGASLAELVDEPETYGWPWDVAVITGGGYGDTAIDVVDERLAEPDVRDDILDHGFYSFDPAIVFGDRPAPVVFGWSGRTAGDLPVREGRAPRVSARPSSAGTAPSCSASPSATRSPSSPRSSAPSTSRWWASASSRPSARSWPTAPGWAPASTRWSTPNPASAARPRSPASACATAPTPRRSSTGSGTTCRAGACSTRPPWPTTIPCGQPRSSTSASSASPRSPSAASCSPAWRWACGSPSRSRCGTAAGSWPCSEPSGSPAATCGAASAGRA